MYYTSHIYT